MRESGSEDRRETIWGINSEDRQWFQFLTLIGGTAGSIILTYLELAHGPAAAQPNEAARNILLSIGASFVASGFIAWGILQAKELMMAIADWIRRATERRELRWREEDREKGRQEGRQEGRREGRQEGRQEGRREGYAQGYADAQAGKPNQPPDAET
jgi:hypothetical protein